ncbi:MAG: DUF3990 domain-containing protein [Tepidisphaeraceae bacterium]|jgi:hypothetical protein
MAALLNEAPDWDGDKAKYVVLWHGCTDVDRQSIETTGIDLSKSRVNLDFGRGFYTTTRQRQAEHWAVKCFDRPSVVKQDNGPVTLRFRVERAKLASLLSLHFVLANYESEDYWSFVQHCRQSRPSKHGKPAEIHDHRGPVKERGGNWYDLVYGPVVADWKQRMAFMDVDQASFQTIAAVELLNAMIQSKDKEKYQWQPIKQ